MFSRGILDGLSVKISGASIQVQMAKNGKMVGPKWLRERTVFGVDRIFYGTLEEGERFY